jgi:hypothetical protein
MWVAYGVLRAFRSGPSDRISAWAQASQTVDALLPATGSAPVPAARLHPP